MLVPLSRSVFCRFSFICRVCCVLALGVVAFASTALAGARDWPSQVRAVYVITFGGFELGKFVFSAEVRAGKYWLNGDAKLSAVFGAFKWRGLSSSKGRIGAGRPLPVAYDFAYKSNSKRGRIGLEFNRGAVRKISTIPPVGPSKKRVPLKPKHLVGVLDPMSAVMALTRHTNGNPCQRKIAIFDGKQRFDLVLSFKGRRPINNRKGYGLESYAFVCRVRYVPIAGHKWNKGTRFMANSKSIEVWLVRAPKARVFLPYKIVIPTIAGPAQMISRRIDVVGLSRVALAN